MIVELLQEFVHYNVIFNVHDGTWWMIKWLDTVTIVNT